MKKLLSKEIVEQAIATIQAAGGKPTIERIRKITGGSPKTIIAIKRLIDDSGHDNIPIHNDSKHDNILSSHDIKILIDTRINQQFELLKSELLSELKKSISDSQSVESLASQIETLEIQNAQLERLCDPDDINLLTKNAEQIRTLQQQLQSTMDTAEGYMDKVEFLADRLRKADVEEQELIDNIERLKDDYQRLENEHKIALHNLDESDDFILKQQQEIEQLPADIKRLGEAKPSSFERSKKAEEERDEALAEVVKLASENTDLRSKLEPIVTTKLEPQSEPAGLTEPEQNDSKNEPEIKFTLDEAHARFLELRKEYPGKKQAELLKMLDAEGYKNSVGKKISPSNLSRWKNADKQAQAF